MVTRRLSTRASVFFPAMVVLRVVGRVVVGVVAVVVLEPGDPVSEVGYQVGEAPQLGPDRGEGVLTGHVPSRGSSRFPNALSTGVGASVSPGAFVSDTSGREGRPGGGTLGTLKMP